MEHYVSYVIIDWEIGWRDYNVIISADVNGIEYFGFGSDNSIKAAYIEAWQALRESIYDNDETQE